MDGMETQQRVQVNLLVLSDNDVTSCFRVEFLRHIAKYRHGTKSDIHLSVNE